LLYAAANLRQLLFNDIWPDASDDAAEVDVVDAGKTAHVGEMLIE
jgi:hypothetical protein